MLADAMGLPAKKRAAAERSSPSVAAACRAPA
jgi:hypothetical protein